MAAEKVCGVLRFAASNSQPATAGNKRQPQPPFRCLRPCHKRVWLFRRQSKSAVQNQSPPQPSVSQIRPWIRFWARFIDVGGICLAVAFPIAMLMGLLFATVLPFLGRETAVVLSVLFPYVVGLVVPFAYRFIEPIFFIIFGTTPGKALLCIDVRTTSGGRLSYNEALKRTLRVWFYGCAMGTIVGFGTLWKARNNLIEGKIRTWDRLGSFRVSHRRIGAVRGTIATVLILVIYGIWAGLREESRAKRDSWVS